MYSMYFPDQNQTIDPNSFVQEMEEHWINRLGNVSSDPLRKTWSQIAEAFNKNIMSHFNNNERTKWQVICPPTGSGKSQSAMLYCALLSKLNDEDHPGVLIVTRLTADCDSMAEQINRHGERETAVAFHSKQTDIKMSELSTFPVVIITHRAYEQALDYLGAGAGIADTWSLFHDYHVKGNRRKLVIIDEALDVIEHSQVNLDGLRSTYGAISSKVRKDFPEEVKAVESVIDLLEKFQERKGRHSDILLKDKPTDLEIPGVSPEDYWPDLTEFRKSFRRHFNDMYVLKKKGALEAIRQKHDNRLRSLHAIFRSWIYHSKIEGRNTINTARLLVPENVKGAVIMDATASSNVVYEVFDNAEVIQPPKGTRKYDNVTLHVSRGHKVGKRYMNDHAKKLCKDLIGELDGILKPDQKCLIVTHKGTEPFLSSFAPKFTMETTHWGKTTGSNEWQDFDTVVIFGIPYRPPTWPINTFFACQGPQSTRWLQDPDYREFKNHKDIKAALTNGQYVVDIVQAINRFRSRRTIDSDGNCPEADVRILTPNNDVGNEIINGIKTNMPGIKDRNWPYKGQTRKVRRSNHELALVKFLEGMEKDDVFSVNHIRNVIGTSPRNMTKITKKVKEPESLLGRSMERLNVKYEVQRHGRTQRAYFSKAA